MVACTSPARLLASSTTPHASIPDYFHACDLRLSPRELFSSIDLFYTRSFPRSLPSWRGLGMTAIDEAKVRNRC
jgi:hypothetical protein